MVERQRIDRLQAEELRNTRRASFLSTAKDQVAYLRNGKSKNHRDENPSTDDPDPAAVRELRKLDLYAGTAARNAAHAGNAAARKATYRLAALQVARIS